MANETAAERYARDWQFVGDDRKVRGLDYQAQDRQDRIYVDENGDSAQTPLDTTPDGFVQQDFEDELVYNPNA